MHVIGAVCTPSSPTSLYRTPPSDKALSDKALSDASSDDDDAIARSNDESSCRTRFAFAAGTGSVVCTSTAPDARPMNSSAPPRATWHRVTARSLGDIPALIPGRAVAICVRRPPPSTATRTAPPPPPSAAATTCRVAAPLPFPRKNSLPPDIGHALPHRLRFAASPSSGFAAGERPTKASAAIAMDGIDVGSILGRSSSASVVGSDDADVGVDSASPNPVSDGSARGLSPPAAAASDDEISSPTPSANARTSCTCSCPPSDKITALAAVSCLPDGGASAPATTGPNHGSDAVGTPARGAKFSTSRSNARDATLTGSSDANGSPPMTAITASAAFPSFAYGAPTPPLARARIARHGANSVSSSSPSEPCGRHARVADIANGLAPRRRCARALGSFHSVTTPSSCAVARDVPLAPTHSAARMGRDEELALAVATGRRRCRSKRTTSPHSYVSATRLASAPGCGAIATSGDGVASASPVASARDTAYARGESTPPASDAPGCTASVASRPSLRRVPREATSGWSSKASDGGVERRRWMAGIETEGWAERHAGVRESP